MRTVHEKNDNRGFSLIELIITVMVMSILAVSLAPQVLKWVENARNASDVQLRNSMVDYAQLALTEPTAYQEAIGQVIYMVAKNDGCIIESATDPADIDSFVAVIANYAGTTATALPDDKYRIDDLRTKTEFGEVTVTVTHGVVSSTINDVLENDDLGIYAWDTVVTDIETGGGAGAPGGAPGGGGGSIVGSITGTATDSDGNTHTFSTKDGKSYMDNKRVFDAVADLATVAGTARTRVYIKTTSGSTTTYTLYQWSRTNGDVQEWTEVPDSTITISNP